MIKYDMEITLRLHKAEAEVIREIVNEGDKPNQTIRKLIMKYGRQRGWIRAKEPIDA